MYVVIWCGRVMCADRDQSVRSWGSVEPGVAVEIRDGANGVMRERRRGMVGRRRERRNERRREKERERRE